MHLSLPCEHLARNRLRLATGEVTAFATGLAAIASLHYRLDRTPHPDEEDGKAEKPASAVGKDMARFAIGVVMPDIGDNVQTQPAMRGNGLVEGSVEERYERFDFR
ncbi:hypothetical protein EME01_23110 [Sinorhizobium meliloti]|nr:hypothetical protein EME01_23110 [Sinorhizobium meliloti]